MNDRQFSPVVFCPPLGDIVLCVFVILFACKCAVCVARLAGY